MIIAKKNNFSLNTKTFLFDNKYQITYDLEICKWVKPEKGASYCYTIASFNKDGEIVSCCDRLFESIETEEDLKSLKVLEKIGWMIITESDIVQNV